MEWNTSARPLALFAWQWTTGKTRGPWSGAESWMTTFSIGDRGSHARTVTNQAFHQTWNNMLISNIYAMNHSIPPFAPLFSDKLMNYIKICESYQWDQALACLKKRESSDGLLPGHAQQPHRERDHPLGPVFWWATASLNSARRW